jgi:protein TonB
MAILRLGTSAILGLVVTFSLIVLMFKLIDSGNREMDEKEAIKIADFLHVEREMTTNEKVAEIEKPDEPEPPPELPDDNIEFETPENMVSMAAAPVTKNLSVGLGSFARDTDFIPVYVPQPQYPRRAQSRGKEGYAVIQVIITTTGGVRDPIMVEEDPEGWGFGRAALKAANKLKYNPRVVDGVPEEVSGVMYKFTFQMQK